DVAGGAIRRFQGCRRLRAPRFRELDDEPSGRNVAVVRGGPLVTRQAACLIVVNPTAGGGLGRAVERRLTRRLAERGVAIDVARRTCEGHGIELAHGAAAAGCRAIVAVGGDGTVNEVVNGLALASSGAAPIGPLLIVSAGTGNDFAAMTGSPRTASRAARALEH